MYASHLEPAECERLAYISGDYASADLFALMDAASDEGVSTPEDMAEAFGFRSVATDYRGIDTPDDLKQRLDDLHTLERALPDDVEDADDLKGYVIAAEETANERDAMREALEALSVEMTERRGKVTVAQFRALGAAIAEFLESPGLDMGDLIDGAMSAEAA